MRHAIPRTARTPRRGYTLVEMIVSIGAASVLTIGLASTLLISSAAMDGNTTTRRRTVAADTQTSLLADLRHATAFTERTWNAVTIVVPDRTGDGQPDSIRYAWSGTPGDPLTYSVNGSAAQTLVADVHQFALDYQFETIVAPVIPEEGAGPSAGTVMFVSGGVLSEKSSGGYLALLFGGGEAAQLSEADFNVETSSEEDEHIALLESWGYTVNKIGASQSQDDFDVALAEADVIYVSPDATAELAADKITGSVLGIVNECAALVDELGFASGTGSAAGRELTNFDTAHYITGDFDSATLTVLSADQMLTGLTGTLGADARTLATCSTSGEPPGLVVLAPGGDLYGGGTAAGRRVFLPWAYPSASIANLNADGQLLMRRAVEWASGEGEDGVVTPKNFGYEDVYAGTAEIRRVQLATLATLAEAGTLQSITVHLGAKDDDFLVAIYSDNGGVPDQLLAQSALTMSSASGGWQTLAVPETALPAGDYWLAVCVKDRNQVLRYQAGGNCSQNNNNAIDHGFSSSWGSSFTTRDWDLSIYGTYTPDPGGVSPSTP